MEEFTLAHTNSVILLINILLLIMTYVGLYDGRPTTCDLQILSLPNLSVVLQKGLRCIGRCVSLLPTFLFCMRDSKWIVQLMPSSSAVSFDSHVQKPLLLHVRIETNGI